MTEGTESREVLWEESVPLMRKGLHKELLRKAYQGGGRDLRVFPARENVFAAMRQTSLQATRVVIIGQDHYFNEHQVDAGQGAGSARVVFLGEKQYSRSALPSQYTAGGE